MHDHGEGSAAVYVHVHGCASARAWGARPCIFKAWSCIGPAFLSRAILELFEDSLFSFFERLLVGFSEGQFGFILASKIYLGAD